MHGLLSTVQAAIATKLAEGTLNIAPVTTLNLLIKCIANLASVQEAINYPRAQASRVM